MIMGFQPVAPYQMWMEILLQVHVFYLKMIERNKDQVSILFYIFCPQITSKPINILLTVHRFEYVLARNENHYEWETWPYCRTENLLSGYLYILSNLAGSKSLLNFACLVRMRRCF